MASSPAHVLDHQAPPPAPVALPVDLPAQLATTVAGDLAAGEAVRTSSLAAALAAVPDPRHRRGRRHELTGGAGDRGVRVLDRGELLRGDRRVGRRAGPGGAELPGQRGRAAE